MARSGRLAIARSRPFVGGGILLLTTTMGYLASHGPGSARYPSATIQAPASLAPAIREAADRYDVPEELIAAVIEAESRFNARAVSRRGARGLMQLMPGTAAALGVDDAFDERKNILAGVRHLRSLMDRFDNNLPLALAAYNAGERAVIDYGGVPPYPQTRAYVRRILRRLERTGAAQRGRPLAPDGV